MRNAVIDVCSSILLLLNIFFDVGTTEEVILIILVGMSIKTGGSYYESLD